MRRYHFHQGWRLERPTLSAQHPTALVSRSTNLNLGQRLDSKSGTHGNKFKENRSVVCRRGIRHLIALRLWYDNTYRVRDRHQGVRRSRLHQDFENAYQQPLGVARDLTSGAVDSVGDECGGGERGSECDEGLGGDEAVEEVSLGLRYCIKILNINGDCD